MGVRPFGLQKFFDLIAKAYLKMGILYTPTPQPITTKAATPGPTTTAKSTTTRPTTTIKTTTTTPVTTTKSFFSNAFASMEALIASLLWGRQELINGKTSTTTTTTTTTTSTTSRPSSSSDE